jgi:hypothetical protein
VAVAGAAVAGPLGGELEVLRAKLMLQPRGC